MNVPNHIGLIPDGNRRWARKRGKNTAEGHKAGSERLKEFVKNCFDMGIPQVTIWVLSTENLNRTKEEVNTLFRLAREYIDGTLDRDLSEKYKASVKFYGNLDKIPKQIVKKIKDVEEKTEKYTEMAFTEA